MTTAAIGPTGHHLREYGLTNLREVHWNSGAAQLLECAIQRGEGELAANGAFVVKTGQFTGRSPKDKYIVREPGTESKVHWGPVNQPMSPESFDRLYARVARFLENKEVFVQDCFGGADPQYSLPLRVITQRAWHSLFGRQLFIRKTDDTEHQPEFTMVYAPEFRAIPEQDGTRS